MFGEWLILLGCLEMVEWLVARKKNKVRCGATSSYCFRKKVENALDMFYVPLAKIRLQKCTTCKKKKGSTSGTTHLKDHIKAATKKKS